MFLGTGVLRAPSRKETGCYRPWLCRARQAAGTREARWEPRAQLGDSSAPRLGAPRPAVV